MRIFTISVALLFAFHPLKAQTVQGTIQKTGANTVTVFGKPNTNLSDVSFDNIVVCVSIPDQKPNPTPVATITSNSIPNFTWAAPSGYPHTTNGRTYYAFNGNDNNNGQTTSWLSSADNPILQITFSGGASGASEIVQLNDRTASGGGPGFDYWYVQIVGSGDVTAYGSPFYGTGAVNGGNSYVSTQSSVNLPVELLHFSVLNLDCQSIQLSWETASEKDNAFFSIERSIDGIKWEERTKVAGLSNSVTTQFYDFEDDKLPKSLILYYRLLQTDVDGQKKILSTKAIGLHCGVGGRLYPNPTIGPFKIQGHAEGNYDIFDTTRKNVMSGQLSSEDTGIDISGLTDGVYFVRICSGNVFSTYKVIKNAMND